MGVQNWSFNAADNTNVDGIDTGEGMARADVNDALRGIMKEAKGGFRQVYSVLQDIPHSKHAGIVAGTNTDNLSSYLDTAATNAVAVAKPLHFPAGTYRFLNWTPPANLEVSTDGRATIFKQLDCSGVATRMITIAQDGIRLWVGGSATLDGSMNDFPNNATEFNAGIFVDPADGVTIKSFHCGDVYGRHIGGDVLCTYDGGTGYLNDFSTGTLYGFNCYRTVAAITAGRTGRIAAIIDQGVDGGEGTGLGAVFIEHDATINSPVEHLQIGLVRGRIMNVVGNPLGARVGRVRIGSVDLDASRPYSAPAYAEGSLSLALTPYLYLIGLAYREVDDIEIGSAKIANCTYDAIRDNGEGATNWSGRVRFGSLELIANGITSGREIALQKTRSFSVGFLKSIEKADIAKPIFLGGVAGAQIAVESIEGIGRLATVVADLRVRDGSINVDEEHLCYYCTGQIDLENLDITGTAVSLFRGANKVPTVKNCTIATPDSVLGSGGDPAPNVRLLNSTIGGTAYDDRLYTPSIATISDPSGGATVDAEARTAINALIDALQAQGVMV